MELGRFLFDAGVLTQVWARATKSPYGLFPSFVLMINRKLLRCFCLSLLVFSNCALIQSINQSRSVALPSLATFTALLPTQSDMQIKNILPLAFGAAVSAQSLTSVLAANNGSLSVLTGMLNHLFATIERL